MNQRKRIFFLKAVLALGVSVVLFHQVTKINEALMVLMSNSHSLIHLNELNDAKVKMNNSSLIAAIREKFLSPPFPRSIPYDLKDNYLSRTSMEMAEHIAHMLLYEANGFFVEARAYDGEARSNTLLLERRLNWTGLLVEPDPINVAHIVEMKRKTWLSPTCLSVRPYPHIAAISRHHNTTKTWRFGSMDVQCLPLYSLLLAMNRTVVNYLSLNVKGDELKVVKTIPFKDLDIKCLSLDYSRDQKDTGDMIHHMYKQGYDLYGSMVHPDHLSLIIVFCKQEPKTSSDI